MNKTDFIQEISKLRPGSTFLVLHRYRNNEGEVADFNIIFNMSYENALRRSIAAVEKAEATADLQRQAKQEVLTSWKNSLTKIATTSTEEIDDAYDRFFDENSKLIDGIKIHRESQLLHLFGLLQFKRVIIPVAYKKVNHRALTVAKQQFMRMGTVAKFRQFAISFDRLERISVQKMSLLPPDEQDNQ